MITTTVISTTTTSLSTRKAAQHEQQEPRMTSLDIAEFCGKQHKDVLKAIRNMESAWEKVQGRKFALLQKCYDLPNGGKKMMPFYSLTKTETLYIATKFKDDMRAKLVLLKGKLKYNTYLVWTEKGRDFILDLVKFRR